MTWAELHEIWNERDTRYSMRKIGGHATPVTDNEHDAIVTWRSVEAMQLDSREQDLARRNLLSWTAPLMRVYR